MADQDPLLERLRTARPTLPAALRARALAAGRDAWTPWWRRLSTWATAAAAALALDAGVLATSAPPPPRRQMAQPSAVVHIDDPEVEALVRQRMAYAQGFQRHRTHLREFAARSQDITDILENRL